MVSIAVVALAGPRLAWASWTTDPVVVRSTTAQIPSIVSCSDGSGGCFVAWIETGVGLRAQHVLASGDIDPAWPSTGAVISSATSNLRVVAAVPDRDGGFYLLWSIGVSGHLSRIVGAGVSAPDWPAGGVLLTHVSNEFSDIIEDGSHGCFVAPSDSVFHFGPDAHPAGGWPASGVPIPHDSCCYPYWPQLVLAPGGDVYVGWERMNFEAPGSWQVLRLTSGGLPAAGWPSGGVSRGQQNYAVDYFVNGWIYWEPPPLVDMSSDGRGGVFLAVANPQPSHPNDVPATLYRINSTGGTPADWPPTGAAWNQYDGPFLGDQGSSAAYVRVCADGADGALFGVAQSFVDVPNSMGFQRARSPGMFTLLSTCDGALWPGVELVPSIAGDAFVSDIYPVAYTQGFTPSVAVGRLGHQWNWLEQCAKRYDPCFGDNSLSATPDGGAILLWSEYHLRQGLFAMRVTATGTVTAVTAAATERAAVRDVRFVRGQGVVARVDLAGAPLAALHLFDIAGRNRASATLRAGDNEATVGGTVGLPAGVYFLSTDIASRRFVNKIVVLP